MKNLYERAANTIEDEGNPATARLVAELRAAAAATVPGAVVMYQWLRAPNDRNGNPGRCYAGYSADGSLVEVLDEGYGGTPREYRDLIQLPSVEISRGEYREWLRAGADACRAARGLGPVKGAAR